MIKLEEVLKEAHNNVVEQLAEQVHNAWWGEKKRQGFHSPNDCPNIQTACGKFEKHCPKCHSDMYPYQELPEHVKEYERVTVRTVLKALEEFGVKELL